MVYYDMKHHRLLCFKKSKTKNKMYDAVVLSDSNKMSLVPFGDKRYANFCLFTQA